MATVAGSSRPEGSIAEGFRNRAVSSGIEPSRALADLLAPRPGTVTSNLIQKDLGHEGGRGFLMTLEVNALIN